MDKTPLYQEIAESIRREIVDGTLHAGDELLPVREMSVQWNCAPGTVQRAYAELAAQGLIISRPGQGTRIAEGAYTETQTPLRRAALAHEAESFLLNMLAAGYSLPEIEQAVRLSLDRWRALSTEPPQPQPQVITFTGSHDPAIALVAEQFARLNPDHHLEILFTGSLGGLIALAEGTAQIAGSHLWDAATDTYNAPFVQRLLPGRRVALLTLAQRHLGLIVPPGNPAGLTGLADLIQPGLRFINRQHGAGTRTWLDAHLQRLGIDPAQIDGYDHSVATHSDVARAVTDRHADTGMGVETVALAYGLDFVPLTLERYDLVIPAASWQLPQVRALADWLATDAAKAALARLGGYDVHITGQIIWIE